MYYLFKKHKSIIDRIYGYFFVSGFSAVINLCSRYIYSAWFDFSYAVVVAYFTGMLVNYSLSTRYVFSSYEGTSIAKTFMKFVMVASFGGVVTTVASVWALFSLEAFDSLTPSSAQVIAHCVGIGTAFFVSFLGHQLFTYRETGIFRRLKRFHL